MEELEEDEELENKYAICDIDFRDSEEYAEIKVRKAKSEAMHNVIGRFIIAVLIIGVAVVLYMTFMSI